MKRNAQASSWEEAEDNLVTQWYFVCKIMGHMVPRTFPYFTFKGLVEEIKKDPEYKKKD